MRWQIVVLAGLFAIGGCNQRDESTGAPATTAQPATAAQAQLSATVTYAGEVENLPPEAVVFVYAREPGKTMPLAVERFTPDQLPMQVGFSQPVEDVAHVEVVARMSLTGAVSKHPGDQEVVSQPIAVADYAQSVPLIIPAGVAAAAIQPAAASIRIKAVIDEQAAIAESARVFVIARMPDSEQPMPVAVKALDVASLAEEVTLTDADSMMAVAKLSRHEQLEVFARLSRNGTAKREVGDWESAPQIVSTTAGDLIQLQINRPVE